MCAGCCPPQRTWGGWSSTEQRCAQGYCRRLGTALPATLLLLCCTYLCTMRAAMLKKHFSAGQVASKLSSARSALSSSATAQVEAMRYGMQLLDKSHRCGVCGVLSVEGRVA